MVIFFRLLVQLKTEYKNVVHVNVALFYDGLELGENARKKKKK